MGGGYLFKQTRPNSLGKKIYSIAIDSGVKRGGINIRRFTSLCRSLTPMKGGTILEKGGKNKKKEAPGSRQSENFLARRQRRRGWLITTTTLQTR